MSGAIDVFAHRLADGAVGVIVGNLWGLVRLRNRVRIAIPHARDFGLLFRSAVKFGLATVRLSVCGVVRTEAVIKGEKKLHGLRWGLLVVGRVAGGDWCQC